MIATQFILRSEDHAFLNPTGYYSGVAATAAKPTLNGLESLSGRERLKISDSCKLSGFASY